MTSYVWIFGFFNCLGRYSIVMCVGCSSFYRFVARSVVLTFWFTHLTKYLTTLLRIFDFLQYPILTNLKLQPVLQWVHGSCVMHYPSKFWIRMGNMASRPRCVRIGYQLLQRCHQEYRANRHGGCVGHLRTHCCSNHHTSYIPSKC